MSAALAERADPMPRGSLRQLADPGLLIPFLEAKVQATFPKEKPTKAILVVYVDARAVASILDRVIGPGAWSFQFQQSPMLTPQGWTAHGRLTVSDEWGRTIYREDLGTGTGNAEMGGKGCASDALKRCAVQLGVGRALYALEPITAPCNEHKKVAPAEMQRAIVAWRAQLEKWAAKFRAGEAVADAPPAAAETEVPGDPSPPETPGTGRAPARGRHAGGASATQQPASSTQTPSGAPPAAGNQGEAGAIRAPGTPASPSLSPGKAEFVALMGELGIRNTHGNRTRAIDALKARTLTSEDLTKPAERRRAEKALRVAFGVKERAEVVVPVPSTSKPGEKHEVKLYRLGEDTSGTCPCEWAQWHADCRHIPAGWRMLALSWLTDQPIGLEREWDGIAIEAVAKEADERYEESLAQARAGNGDEAADRAWAASEPDGAAP